MVDVHPDRGRLARGIGDLEQLPAPHRIDRPGTWLFAYHSPVDDLEKQRALRLLRDEALSTPNCDECLHPMEPAERDGVPVWKCPECGSERASA